MWAKKAVSLLVCLGLFAMLSACVQPVSDSSDSRRQSSSKEDREKDKDESSKKKDDEEEDMGARLLEEDEFRQLLQDKYGITEEPKPESDTQIEEGLFDALDQVRTVNYTLPDQYPAEVTVTVTAPDMEKLLMSLDFGKYRSADAFRKDVLAKIAAGSYEMRTTTVTVTVTGPGFDPAKTEDFELLDALYGGALSFYRNALFEDFTRLYGDPQAQEESR